MILVKKELLMRKKVVITGMGIISPIGHTLDSFWFNLSNGVSGIDTIKSFDTSSFASRIGGEIKNFDPTVYLSSKEINRTDTFTHYALAATHEAVEQASLDIKELDPFRVGVLVGSGTGGTGMILENHQTLLTKGARRVSPYLASGMLINSSVSEIAIKLGAKGKSGSFVTACAASSNCIGEAMRTIQYGDADIMIAGGTEGAITPLDLASFTKIKALSTRNDYPQEASRPFDRSRDGFVIGSGGGIVVLESEESAVRRGVPIIAELAGYGATNDAYGVTAPDPEGHGVIMAMKRAIEDANLTPDDIDYVNAHGTSTKLNDQSETYAIKRVFGERANELPISSIKSMTGHLLGGAGAAELIASVLSIQNKLVPPTINHTEPDEDMNLNFVPNRAQNHRIRTVLSNSFGFGGHNACLVVKEWKEERE
jgi:3-oxoacyl-[acyl-carrier-protein] synthase II